MTIDTDTINRALADLKTIEESIRELKKVRSFVRKLRKQVAAGEIAEDKAQGFIERAAKVASIHASQITDRSFALGQGDDSDREDLAAVIAERFTR